MINQKNYPKNMLFVLTAGIALLLLMAQPTLAADDIIPSGYWQLEETDPGTAGVVDDSAAVNGSCTTCPVSTTGQVDLGFDFSTVDAEVDFADNLIFNWADTASFSIELWMKIAAAPAARQVMMGRFSANTLWWIGLENTGNLSAFFQDADGGAGTATITTTSAVADGNWHHVVAVLDRAAGAGGQILIYVDGELSSTTDLAAINNGAFTATSTVNLGYLKTGGMNTFLFAGQLDNVAVYSANALTATEVGQSFASGSGGFSLNEEYAPFYSGTRSETVAMGFPLTLTATASGNPTPDSYTATGLPFSATIGGTTGIINWLPSNLDIDLNEFTVTAENTVGTGTQNWAVDVVNLCTADLDTYWKLEANGGPFVDTEDNAANATCTDCPTQVAGKVDFGQSFDATDDQVDIPANVIFSWADTASFSIELWMKIATAPGVRQVMIGRFDTAFWWLGVEDDGTVVAQFRDTDGGAGTSTIATTANVADDAWHHVVAVLDRDAGAGGQIVIYVDGVAVSTSDLAAVNNGAYTATTAVTLGYLNTGGLFRFGGTLDEVATYNTALTDNMVEQHFNAESGQSYCNGAPTITSTAVETATEGVAYTYTATATDPETNDITWDLSTFPAGMEIDENTGEVTWTPGNAASASEDVVIVATDEFGAAASQTFAIAVTMTDNNAPVISTTAPATATEGAAYTYDANATDADTGDTLTWSLAAGAPAGMSVVAGTGVVTWTPADGTAGTDVTYTLNVSDGNGGTDTEVVTVAVSAPGSGGGGGGGGGCFITSLY